MKLFLSIVLATILGYLLSMFGFVGVIVGF